MIAIGRPAAAPAIAPAIAASASPRATATAAWPNPADVRSIDVSWRESTFLPGVYRHSSVDTFQNARSQSATTSEGLFAGRNMVPVKPRDPVHTNFTANDAVTRTAVSDFAAKIQQLGLDTITPTDRGADIPHYFDGDLKTGEGMVKLMLAPGQQKNASEQVVWKFPLKDGPAPLLAAVRGASELSDGLLASDAPRHESHWG